MEDGGKVVTNEVEPLSTSEPVGSINPADSTSKLSPNELSPDSTSEFDNTITKTERFDPFVSSNNKVNGDCSIDCSVPSPSPAPTNNNNTSIYKTSLERDISYNEKTFVDVVEERKRCTVDKDLSASEAEIASAGFKDKDHTKNLCHSPQQKHENLTQDDHLAEVENFQSNQCTKISNLNEVSSTLEEKTTCEESEVLLCASPKNETMPAAQKTKRSSSDSSSSSSCKSNDKPPARNEQKSSVLKGSKIAESAPSECNQKQNDMPKGIDKASRNNKRKCEEKISNLSDGELNEPEKFPIQYKGFKKRTNTENENREKRFSLKWNPFNPACKPKRKNKNIPSRLPTGDEIDCSSLQQSEYAQYLGLQPILKFRCSNCGSSAFQSMVALNTHQIECTKTGKSKLDKSPPSSSNSIIEPKSTNIKLTRKVFLCSACGTYYEHWNLFLHMREVHRRYICLYCLGMFSVAEKLSEHLFQKHKVTHQNFNNLEDFHKHSYQTFFLLCLTCDKVFSEMDDFYGHMCTAGKKSIDNSDTSNKSEVISGQESNATTSGESTSNVSNNKTGAKRLRDANKKNTTIAKAAQPKKDELLIGNASQKPEDSIITDSKEEITKSNDVSINRTLETNAANVHETIHSEHNTHIQQNENEMKGVEQEVKQQESQVSTETDKPIKSTKKTKPLGKKTVAKRKKPKEKEDDNDIVAAKIKKVVEDEPTVSEVKSTATVEDSHSTPIPIPEAGVEVKEESLVSDVQQIQPQETNIEKAGEIKEEVAINSEPDKSQDDVKDLPSVSKEELTTATTSQIQSQNINTSVEVKNKLQANLLKFKLPGMESDNESDDSQKLSLVVDENPISDAEHKASVKSGDNSETDSEVPAEKVEKDIQPKVNAPQILHIPSEGGGPGQDITLASEDGAVMALTLDDKIENIPIQTVLKECVRTSCMSCNYCRHAVKIAVNGKQLAIHILSEHRYMPIKNETTEDVINKLKTSLTTLQTMYFNTETYDSSDPSIHVPYDQDSSFDCFQCNYVTTSHRDLFAHKRKSHAKSLLLCIMCKSNFYSYSELLCHLCTGSYNAEIQFHNVDINFRCCFCRLDTIPSAFRLMVHLRKTHHTCDICLENGVDQQKLSTHMWKHKLNHLCYRCGIAYASKPDITKHLFWKHGHESVLCKKCLQKKWPHVYHFCIPPTSFICEECNTSFSKAVALKVHKRIHGNDFPYTCSECNKKFVSKKLLQRHEERHIAIKNNSLQNNIEANKHEEQKEEIINVSDVINENKETNAADFTDSKEVEAKDKSHRKHKKEKDKEKKDKQVVDVYDLPPLNLSSESDSSDEDNNVDKCKSSATANTKGEVKKDQTDLQENSGQDDKISSQFEENASDHLKSDMVKADVVNNECETAISSGNDESKPQSKEQIDLKKEDEEMEGLGSVDLNKDEKIDGNLPLESTKLEQAEEMNTDLSTSDYKPDDNKDVQDIWKNFYCKNPQSSRLPYPLCAIKSEIALGIIMGDHDYCSIPIEPAKFREDIPSTSGVSVPLINDQLQEINETPLDKLNDATSIAKDLCTTGSPLDSPKKKPKSPKKKNSKVENENNSSSSSDSSSESSSSSCSCGPNCSCSSTSSNSSSSSSSDSDSSGGEEGTKQERKRKKRERRSKNKSDHEPEQPKEQIPPQPEKIIPLEPEDPPIRESELETDETTTDEEFYDQQPQRIANQLLAEKRNQLMLLASAANANNGNASPSPIVDVLPPSSDLVNTQKQKIKTKRKRKITTKGKGGAEKAVTNSQSYQQYSTKDIEPIAKPLPPYHSNIVPQLEQTKMLFVQTPQAPTETPGSGSETEKSRSSKRRRIPNKFYGYSSGDEEEKAAPSPKWRKQQDIVSQPVRVQPVHPPTPRIQLTVPKQVIRKPYKFQKTPAKPPQQQPPQNSSSDSTDSSSEMDNQRTTSSASASTPHIPGGIVAASGGAVGGNVGAVAAAPTVVAGAASSVVGIGVSGQDSSSVSAANSQKNDKDVYCYCRCPYDEVSEMIACDDENCEIEWFHFECVGILVPPRGQWFCPGCRKARGLPT